MHISVVVSYPGSSVHDSRVFATDRVLCDPPNCDGPRRAGDITQEEAQGRKVTLLLSLTSLSLTASPVPHCLLLSFPPSIAPSLPPSLSFPLPPSLPLSLPLPPSLPPSLSPSLPPSLPLSPAPSLPPSPLPLPPSTLQRIIQSPSLPRHHITWCLYSYIQVHIKISLLVNFFSGSSLTNPSLSSSFNHFVFLSPSPFSLSLSLSLSLSPSPSPSLPLSLSHPPFSSEATGESPVVELSEAQVHVQCVCVCVVCVHIFSTLQLFYNRFLIITQCFLFVSLIWCKTEMCDCVCVCVCVCVCAGTSDSEFRSHRWLCRHVCCGSRT